MLSERPSKQTRTTAAAWSFEYWAKGLSQATHRIVGVGWGTSLNLIPAIAQLAEHLTVDSGSDQMVPGSIPGGRTFLALRLYAAREVKVCHHIPETWWNQIHVQRASQV